MSSQCIISTHVHTHIHTSHIFTGDLVIKHLPAHHCIYSLMGLEKSLSSDFLHLDIGWKEI